MDDRVRVLSAVLFGATIAVVVSLGAHRRDSLDHLRKLKLVSEHEYSIFKDGTSVREFAFAEPARKVEGYLDALGPTNPFLHEGDAARSLPFQLKSGETATLMEYAHPQGGVQCVLRVQRGPFWYDQIWRGLRRTLGA